MKEFAKNLDKSELWMMKWSSISEICEDKKRTRIPNIPLNEMAKKFWVMLSTNWNSIYRVEICLYLTELFAQQTEFKTLLTYMEVGEQLPHDVLSIGKEITEAITRKQGCCQPG